MADFYAPWATPEDAALAEEDRLRQYWGSGSSSGDAPPPADPVSAYYGPPAPPQSAPYQPNPGAPGYQPNPGAAQPMVSTPAPMQSRAASPETAAMMQGINLTEAPKNWSPATGPTPQDDAAFAEYVRQQTAPKVVAKQAPAGGGAAPSNPDPYGLKSAKGKFFGSFDEERDALRKVGQLEGQKALAVSEMQREQSRVKEEDAAIARLEEDEFFERHEKAMTDLKAQQADVASKKVKPMSYLEAGGGNELLVMIGAIAGGLYMGATKSGVNPYLAHLDKVIDRQIAADERNIDNQKDNVRTQMNFLGQQMSMFKDKQQAKLAYRHAQYEAFKDALSAEAAKYDSPVYTANVERAISEIDRKQGEVELQFAQRSQQAAASAANANAARAKEVRDFRNNLYLNLVKEGVPVAAAEQEANRQMALSYGLGEAVPHPAMGGGGAVSNPLAAVPKDLKSEGAKEWKEHALAEKGISALDNQFKEWARVGVTDLRQQDGIQATISGIYKTSLGPGMSSNDDFDHFIKPNIPRVGESAETIASKQRNIAAFIRSKVATPILDNAAPGWRQPTSEEKKAAIGARPVR